MKQTILLALVFLFILPPVVYAQTQFENAGFEEWEDIPLGNIPEPVDWSSIRTCLPVELQEVTPDVWNISDDAHTGNHSVYLTNVFIFGFVATGTLTNGRILADLDPTAGNSHTDAEDPRWNTPFTARPDSLVGWYKSIPTEGDFPTVHVVLHTDYASIPQDDSSTWVGEAFIELSTSEVSTWTRFSTPFHYYSDGNPEYLLTILTAGNATDALDGSEVWFDDLEMIYNSSSVTEYNAERLSVFAAGGRLNILLEDGKMGQADMRISDITGRTVYKQKITTGLQNSLQPGLTEGIYIVSVSYEDRLYTQKVFLR
jgi:hypothetical protein